MKLLTRTTSDRSGDAPPLDPPVISLRRDEEYCAADDKLRALRGDYAQCERDINDVDAARDRTVRASDLLNRTRAGPPGEPP